MNVKIRRFANVQSVTVGTSTASSTSARCDGMAGAVVVVKGNTASATLTVWGSTDDATFAALASAGGGAATLTIPANGAVVEVPDAVFAVPYVRFVSSPALATAATVAVAFKS